MHLTCPSPKDAYIGRFAPSPTGPLHFGSLVAAMASYLEAKMHGGQWLIRMEDLDQHREVPGAASRILTTLEAFGFEWDGEILYQSRRHDAYEQALEALKSRNLAYACGCSRKEIAEAGLEAADGGWRYPGRCRGGLLHGRRARAWRMRVDDAAMELNDAVQGRYRQRLESAVGDFVLRRADGVFAYQLAVVVDDAFQHMTHVVRGSDLLASTPRQIHLQKALGFSIPRYMHIPVVTHAAGGKLSKQTHATPIRACAQTLLRGLDFLGQSPDPGLQEADSREIWRWARKHWNAARIPARMGMHEPYTHHE